MASNYWKRREKEHYIHNGTYYSTVTTPLERLQAAMLYDDIRPDDILVAGYPKSGNHLVSDIAKKLRNKGDINKSHREACDVFLENLTHDSTLYNRDIQTPQSLAEVSALNSPRVIITHLRYNELPPKVQDGHCKIIHISRDPRDVACSWYHMERKIRKAAADRKGITDQRAFDDWDEYVAEVINGTVLFGSWCEHMKSFLKVKNMPHILWIKFEDLMKEMGKEIKRIQTFMEEDLDEASLSAVVESCQIENMKMVFPNAFFLNKGEVGSWKHQFTAAQCEAFQKKIEEDMKGYERDLPLYMQ